MEAYCENEICEYNESGSCVCENALRHDENGLCISYRHKSIEAEN